MAKAKKTRRPKKHIHVIDACFDGPPMLVRRRGVTFDDLVYWTGLGAIGETLAVKFGTVLEGMPLDEIGNMLMANFSTARHALDSKKRRHTAVADDPTPGPMPPPKRGKGKKRG